MQKEIYINDNSYLITGDAKYLESRGEHFEPNTVNIFKHFCCENSYALDIGANIGLTSIALANICQQGKVVAIEPIIASYKYLTENIKKSGLNNISLHNFGVGNKEDNVVMQGCNDFLAGSFVAERYKIHENHFSIIIPMKTLDRAFPEFLIDSIDFIKLDLEGYELFALEGAQKILKEFKPIVYLEMNHWCLNVFHRITLPEFHEKLMQIFPYIFAIDETSYLDFSDYKNFHYIAHEHITKFKFSNIVAGFNKSYILDILNLFSK
ncbi:FkbM family methyltransferase [Rickettsiella endosymbiont of Aleochara curtula]|uniref:FkbM family methyltransferase n=1 Tax=Rickettsiella endosymbiont of Aleochara curtula TaxID=3077936 RepID=UPI00313C071B